jgi:hypothetical protein
MQSPDHVRLREWSEYHISDAQTWRAASPARQTTDLTMGLGQSGAKYAFGRWAFITASNNIVIDIEFKCGYKKAGFRK